MSSSFEPPFQRCPLFYGQGVGSALFSCDGYMVILVQFVTQFAVLLLNTYCTLLSGLCLVTEYRGRVVGPIVQCAGNPWFQSGPRDRLLWLIFRAPFYSLQADTANGPQTVHDQLYIISSLLLACRSFIRRCIIEHMKEGRRAVK